MARRADPRRRLAAAARMLAAGHFDRLGLSRARAQRAHARGEIDLIAFDGQTLRVRRRSRRVPPVPGCAFRPASRCPPACALSAGDCGAWRWRGSAASSATASARAIRFDAVGVLLDGRGRVLRLDHIEGAW